MNFITRYFRPKDTIYRDAKTFVTNTGLFGTFFVIVNFI